MAERKMYLGHVNIYVRDVVERGLFPGPWDAGPARVRRETAERADR